eukprot:7410684-Pyramimonas_sp.AAC.1
MAFTARGVRAKGTVDILRDVRRDIASARAGEPSDQGLVLGDARAELRGTCRGEGRGVNREVGAQYTVGP